MGLLERYIVDEMGGEKEIEQWNEELRKEPDRNAPLGLQTNQANRQASALGIYQWWKHQKPKDEKRRNDLLHELYGKKRASFRPIEGSRFTEYVPPQWDGNEQKMHQELRDLEKKIDEDEQSMLHRLIDIRGSLWT